MRLCHTCKHAQPVPLEVYTQLKSVLDRYPYKFYCAKLEVIKVYNPERPTQVFDCPDHEPREAV